MKKLKRTYLLNHLWIKNYIVVFCVIVLLAGLFNTSWQHNVIRYIFEEEKEAIIESQKNITDMLVNTVVYMELKEGVAELSGEQMKEAAEKVFYDSADKMALFYGNELISGTYPQKDNMDELLLEQKINVGKYLFKCYELADVHYIKAVSVVEFHGQEYKIITTTDISKLYEYGKISHQRSLFISILGTILTALFFLIFFYWIMKPLKKISDGARKAAKGNYTKYLKIKNNDELGVLADSINSITQAADNNARLLQEASTYQKQFINRLSHEMSTPLTSILCYSEMLLKSEELPREKTTDYAEVILSEGRRLKILAEKLTDFLYVGKINECDKVEVSIKEVINDIFDTMTPVFEKKRVYFKKKIHDFVINVQLELFKTMIYNYLDNAINASDEDDIVEINVYQTHMENIIEISDHGIGIAEEEIEKIEEPFYKTEKSYNSKDRGSGLGMALCKKIVAAHEGEVTILSRLHKGTTIRIKFQQDRGIEM